MTLVIAVSLHQTVVSILQDRVITSLPIPVQTCPNGYSDEQVYSSDGYNNQAKFSHELIAGGAAFEGMKLFEDHQRKEGMSISSRIP